MTKFSVIIPAYNAEKTITKCIKSVLNQTYTNWEILVINDGSVDSTKTIAERMISAECVINKRNAGVSAARNTGLALSKGEYILFLDADDFLPDDALESYEKAISKENEPDVVLGSFNKVYPKRQEWCNPVGEESVYVYDCNRRTFNPFISRLMGTVWGKCYKADFIKFARFDEQLTMCEDAEFNYRNLINAKKIVYIKAVVYNYVYSQSSTIRKYDDMNLAKYTMSVNKIIEQNMNTDVFNDVLEFVCTVYNVICFNLVLTNRNKSKYTQKKETLRHLKNERGFKIALENVEIKRLDLKHRLAILLVQHDMFGALCLMSVLNQLFG